MPRRSPNDPAPKCFVCDLATYSGELIYGPTPGKDRGLCKSCKRQGFALESDREHPYRGTIVTPEGVRVAYNLRDPKPAGKTKLRRLRDEDTSKIPGTEGLFLR